MQIYRTDSQISLLYLHLVPFLESQYLFSTDLKWESTQIVWVVSEWKRKNVEISDASPDENKQGLFWRQK